MLIIGMQLLLGFFYGQCLEWFLHKNLLHHIGKKRGSIFSYHFHNHHKASRQNLFYDRSYEGEGEGVYKEVRDLSLLSLIHLPIIFLAPAFLFGAAIQAILYYVLHRQSHLNPEWCKQYLPWHYDHHMAPNQDANWGVTTDWIDRLMGTREIYLGTEKEQRDTKRRMKRLGM
jgi:sterol desaturase/sphingolipid hydroxylase (fatty acid hydroxylase superfamily)